jgi:3-hydroxyisobutyrate dehydrogenase-like beta-hydroxyacid dehydrogenase
MGDRRIGIIGFGEVGSMFSNVMAERGARVRVYDALLEEEGGEQILTSRIEHEGVELTSLQDMLSKSNMVLSVVPTQVAETVARQISRDILSMHIYVDLNSTSPTVKSRIGQVIQATGASFVEGAILGAVGATGAQTRIFFTGERGAQVAEAFRDLGLNASFYAVEIGKASAFKMLRSIFSKGIEALLLEMLIAGKRAGIEEDLWKDVTDYLLENPFDRVAENWICSHAVACERRQVELLQVLETMRELEVEPIMTAATEVFYKRSTSLGFAEKFPGKPAAYLEVVDFISERA